MVGARARVVRPPGNQLRRRDDSPFLIRVPKPKLARRQRLRYHRPAELDRFLDLDVLEERKPSLQARPSDISIAIHMGNPRCTEFQDRGHSPASSERCYCRASFSVLRDRGYWK